MAKLTISQAARVVGVARSTLHRAIKQGRISRDPDGHLDTAELLRVGYTLQYGAQQERHGARQHATPRSSEAQQVAPPVVEQRMSLLEQERELLQRERDLLQRELERAQEREQVALERERAAREREALLLHMFEQAQQQSQRLLSAPQRSPAVRNPAGLSPTWQVVLDYMRSRPGPHRPYEIQTVLGASYAVRHVMRRMADAGILRRHAPGVYVLAEESA